MRTKLSELLGLNGNPPPAVFWRKNAKQYMTYIGFHNAQKGKAKGLRVRTAHYLGKDQREANLNAILIDRRWDRVVAQCKQRSEKVQTILDESRRTLPVWPTEDQRRRQEATPDELIEMGLLIELPPAEEDQFITLTMLRNRYIAAQQARVGLKGRRGLKANTVRGNIISLNNALKGIDANMNALALTREHCRQLVDYWLCPDRNISERTAANYCKTFLAMLTWADNEEVLGFRRPKCNDLFSFSNTRGKIERFDPERMKIFLSHATERNRLYILLGLNTGYNQIDVANLRKDQIVEINGEVFLVRSREKTSHQNDFKTQHYLWPETWALLQTHLAPDNAENLALVNVKGLKLIRGKTDNIRDRMNEIAHASGIVEITYKQCRKFGITAVKRISRNSDTARLYAAQTITGVMSHYDRDDFFEPLTDALKLWREELKQQGVL